MKRSNIEVQRDMNDFIMFKTMCECCSSDHTMTVVVEKWGSYDSLQMVSIYYKCAYSDFGASGSFFEKVMRRIKTAVKILFAGYAETQGDFIFRDRENLQDFTATLEEAARQVAASGTPN